MKIYVFGRRSITAALLSLALMVTTVFFINRSTLPVSAPQSKNLPIYSVDIPEKKVAVTFDAAWNDSDIDAIIGVLDKYNCKSTFFTVGDWVEKYPEAVKKLFAAGHEIANHSNSHAHYNNLTAVEMLADMNKCDARIKALTGTTPSLFRPPYGEYNDTLVKACHQSGRYCIQWDIDSLDWKGLSADTMVQRILPKLQNGSIILFHNGTDNTAAALPRILEEIINEGYTFSTVGELIYRENYIINHQGRQIKNKQ